MRAWCLLYFCLRRIVCLFNGRPKTSLLPIQTRATRAARVFSNVHTPYVAICVSMLLEISLIVTTSISLYFCLYNLCIWMMMAVLIMFRLTTTTQLHILRRSHNYYIFFAGALFAAAGLPPLAGFFTKLFLFVALFNAPGSHYVFLYAWFLLLLSLWFYFKNTRHVFSVAVCPISSRAALLPVLLGALIGALLVIFFFIFFMDDWFTEFLYYLN